MLAMTVCNNDLESGQRAAAQAEPPAAGVKQIITSNGLVYSVIQAAASW